MSIFKIKTAAASLGLIKDRPNTIPGEVENRVIQGLKNGAAPAVWCGAANTGMTTVSDLAAALRPKPQINPAKAIEAIREMEKDAGQITFYIYDRGQCFNKNEETVVAFVNMNGCAAHYAINSSEKVWAFFQMPHLNTEQRACERMGYKNLDAMHTHLFGMFDQHLQTIGWNEKHGPITIF